MACRSDYADSTNMRAVSRDEFDKVTRIACTLAAGLESLFEDYAGYSDNILDDLLTDYIDREAHDWIISHKAKDAARKEALKKAALAKLTQEEREILGLLNDE